jgi:hypothetical protein
MSTTLYLGSTLTVNDNNINFGNAVVDFSNANVDLTKANVSFGPNEDVLTEKKRALDAEQILSKQIHDINIALNADETTIELISSTINTINETLF